MVREISRIEGFAEEKARAEGLLTQVTALKKQKILSEHEQWYAGAMHQTSDKLDAEMVKRLLNVKGNEAATREVWHAHVEKLLEQSAKLRLAQDQQVKGYIDGLAQASILITDQIAWKDKSWELEKKISRENLEQWFIGKDLSEGKKDEYRGLLALTNQAKEYNRERQKAVELGTLEGWAIERAAAAQASRRTTIKDLMTGAESFLTDAFGSAIQGILSKEKKSLREMGATIVQGLILELNKKSVTKVFDKLGQLLAPDVKSTRAGGVAGGVGGGKDPGQELSAAAKLLSLSGLQLGLSAGGLLLSGIGIAVNSQALVYAGAILQIVALAIQIYEIFTATNTAMLLTGAAAALTAAAFSLEMAAIMLMSTSFFHSGGIVMHRGGLVPAAYAHGGLAVDERLIVAQTGEGILPRSSMARLGPGGFEALRRGDFAAGAGGGGGPSSLVIPLTIRQITPEGRTLSKHQERIVVDLVKKRLTHREIRVPSRRRG